MPAIIYEGDEMTAAQKAQLVKEFTASAAKITGLPEAAFYVFLKENSFTNIGVGGKLLSENPPTFDGNK